jgi:hypothetical protein
MRELHGLVYFLPKSKHSGGVHQSDVTSSFFDVLMEIRRLQGWLALDPMGFRGSLSIPLL